jgi:hypothetical protein
VLVSRSAVLEVSFPQKPKKKKKKKKKLSIRTITNQKFPPQDSTPEKSSIRRRLSVRSSSISSMGSLAYRISTLSVSSTSMTITPKKGLISARQGFDEHPL